jgi:hypothetical protein
MSGSVAESTREYFTEYVTECVTDCVNRLVDKSVTTREWLNGVMRMCVGERMYSLCE